MKPAPGKTPQQLKLESAPAQALTAPEAPAQVNDVVRPAPTPDLNPRNRAAAEIAKRANADADVAASETVPEGDGESMPEAPTAAPAEVAAPEVPQQVAEGDTTPEAPAAPAAQAAEAAPTAPAGIDPNAEYDITVDGLPVKLKGSQILSRVQKGEAADYRLQLASKLLEEAKRTVGQSQPPAQGAAAQPAVPSQPAQVDVAQLAHLIQFGTTEQAAEALKALNAQRPDTVTQQGLQTFMAQALPRMLDQQFAFREGLAFLQKEHSDMLNDPYLKQLIVHQENEKRRAGDQRPHVALYKEIVEDLRKHFNKPMPAQAGPAVPTQAATTAQTIAQKQAAKAAAPVAPRLAAARLEGGADAAKPKTREEIISDIRKARGQHALTVR